MGKLQVVVGGQYGSEAKGHVAAYLGSQEDRPVAVRVAGPNAGHTAVYERTGQHVALRQIPVAAVTNPQATLFLAAGSEIEPRVLLDEIDMLESMGISVRSRLYIDGQATIITEEDKRAEGGNDGALQRRLGSTGKGIGSARAERIWRRAPVWKDQAFALGLHYTLQTDTAEILGGLLRRGRTVLIEGTQGYGLGLHQGNYPFCTSSDCRAVDFLGMTGLSPWAPGVDEFEVWVTLRTFPIRVAGNSGPMRYETSWEALEQESGGYIKPEKTTVTKKIRRVGRWDGRLAASAVRANGGPSANVQVALMFADYIDPTVAKATDYTQLTRPVHDFIDRVESDCGASVALVGTGPDTIIDLR